MLTPHQQKCLIDAHHVSVTANAGSGKTRVLVERYLHVLLNGKATVPEVVALTYTDKAASELRRKIAERISQALQDAAGGPSSSALEAIRDQLSLAPIATIHAFCSRLLHEHPVEAGVDAAFSVLEGVDRRILLQETVNETFQLLLRPDASLRNELVAALNSIGKHAVLRIVSMMVDKREQFDRVTEPGGLYSREDQAVLAHWRAALSDSLAASLDNPVLSADLAGGMSAAAGKDAADARTEYEKFNRAETLAEKAAAFVLLFQMMLKKDGGWYVSFIGKEKSGAAAVEAARLAEWRKRLLPLIPVAVEPEEADRQHRLLLSYTRTLLAVARQALDRYDQKKQESGHLDFDDLQVRMKRLLEHEPVRSRLSRRFKFIMVDEYQDTNLLQYEILLPLLDRLAHGNLFIVGDPKQSIYGFRNADIRVFEQTKQDMRRVAGPAADVVLEESFRPLRDLAAFVNLVFSRLMGTESGGTGQDGRVAATGVRYDPLVRARQNEAPGRVELLVPGADVKESEEDLIARRILRLKDEGAEVFDHDEKPHRATFGDIAILLRSRTSLPAVEDAFIRHRIPYVVSAGVGYFQTQDVFDFFNYFRFILNPADDLALAGILRSAFFVLSDAALFELSNAFSDGTLWDRVKKAAGGNGASEALRRAAKTLQEDLDVGLRLPVPELIAWIVRRTLYLAKVAGTVRGDQARANLEKLQRMARSYEAAGFTNLYDFVRRMVRLIEEEEREGQGEIETHEDAVQVMTVHAAKGLEFPIVVLPSLQRKFRYDGEPLFDDRLGIGFTPRADSREDVPLVSYLLEQGRMKTLAEEKRIFYVACTRARDMLVLSGTPSSERPGPDCLRWLFQAIGLEGDTDAEQRQFPCTTRSLRREGGRFVSAEERHMLTLHVVRSVEREMHDRKDDRGGSVPVQPVLMIEPLVRMPKGETYSASKIRTYKECPFQYYLRYVLGMPVERHSPRAGDGDDSEIPADLRGRLFHGVMQCAQDLLEDRARRSAELDRLLALEENLNSRISSEIRREVLALVDGVMASPALRKLQESTHRRTEFTISAPLGENFLTGTLDLVARDAQGNWHVLDYKTDDVEPAGLSRQADRYWSQLEFYALLLHKLVSVDVINATILFAAVPDRPLSRQYEAKEMIRIEQEIADVILRVQRQEFPPRQTACPGCPLQPKGCTAVAALPPSGASR